MEYEHLQARLGYRFGDRRILIQSLTHTSYGHENLRNLSPLLRDNERLEFLGDSVLGVVISDMLLETFATANEGQLSRVRAAVVNEKTLAEIARSIDLAQCIRLGKGELQSGGKEKASILSSALEAIIAAIYLDGGFNAVYPIVRHLFKPLFESFKNDPKFLPFQDHKTQLQEYTQSRWKITPTYQLLTAEGPDHAKTFQVEILMNGNRIGNATGKSIKEAEQNAARSALEDIVQK